MIKVILWDIDGTLLNFLKAENYAIKKCFSELNICECDDALVEEYSAINKKHWEMLERGEITKPQVLRGRFEELFRIKGIDFSDIDALNAIYQFRLGDKIFFNDNSFELVKSLKGRVKQYAVTNGTVIAQENKLKVSGLDEIFDGVFISDKLGFEKPNIEFFNRVFDEIGSFNKDEIVIIGDSLTSDILGGNNAGIVCCWYNPNSLTNNGKVKIDYEIKDLNEITSII